MLSTSRGGLRWDDSTEQITVTMLVRERGGRSTLPITILICIEEKRSGVRMTPNSRHV